MFTSGVELNGNKIYTEDNPEYLQVTLDSKNKILDCMTPDGTKVFNSGIETEKINIGGNEYYVSESPEWLRVIMDKEGKIIAGIRNDGKTYIAEIEGVDIDTIKQEIQEYVEEITKNIKELNDTFKYIDDIENRREITTDASSKIISYRKDDGTLIENVGIESPYLKTDYFILPENSLEQVDKRISEYNIPKKWYLPKFGKVNIKEETFYLTSVDGFDTKNDVVCIQVYDDNDVNASKRLTISYYYLKSSLNQLPDGGYDRTSIDENSIQLELHAGKDVTTVGDKYFATAIYRPITDSQGYISDYTKIKATKVTDPETGEVVGYEVDGVSTEVKQVKDVPPYKAWKVNKKIEHYCLADIDFGNYYNKNNVPISIKYQGSYTTRYRKRGLRITFYKKNDYKKKDKIKIGEFVRLSGFNMKSYFTDPSRVKDPVFSYLFMDIWESRGKDCYPWNKDSIVYNGATGMIKSFPIETYWGNEFYGLQLFSLKKDEKNYMLDGDDDSSGIFASGDQFRAWENGTSRDFADEMGVDGRELAYPDWEDSLSVESASAVDEMFKYIKGFIEGSIEIDGEVVEFKREMLEEHIDIASCIDYYIILQLFMMWDNNYHNLILHSRRDKKKFYFFFYDIDITLGSAYNYDILTASLPYGNVTFWQKLTEVYKDSIINRYSELRKNILTVEHIKSIYDSYVSGIPQNVNESEKARWGSGDVNLFNNNLVLLSRRFEWLDNNYFILKN